MALPAVVHTDQLTRRADGAPAVEPVDLAVHAGEIYGLVGSSDSGASTVVRMLATLLRPTGGSARVLGYDLLAGAADIRLRVGVSIGEPAIDGDQTGREFLRHRGDLFGLRRSETDRCIQELAPLVSPEQLDQRVADQTPGARRRLDLASADIHHPRLLLLDRPVTGLDPTDRDFLVGHLRRRNQESGLTVLLATPQLAEIEDLADRVGLMVGGSIVASGPPAELEVVINDDHTAAVA